MDRAIGTAFLACLAVSCSATGPVEPVRPGSAFDLPIVQGDSYTGVIFPASRAVDISSIAEAKPRGYWTPDHEQIDRCESKLRQGLERLCVDPLESNPFVTQAVHDVLSHLTGYRRQYIGIITATGSKRILLNCFPGPPSKGEDFFPNWRQEIVFVLDGGSSFWRIQYDVATDKYTEFDSNGDA
jgi:hypothetical protein